MRDASTLTAREQTIRGVPLSRCTIEQLVRERDAAESYYQKYGVTLDQRRRQRDIEREIRRRR